MIERDVIMQFLKQKSEEWGIDFADADDNFRLMDMPFMDSVVFFELIILLETETGRDVDLSKHGVEMYSTIGGLIKCLHD